MVSTPPIQHSEGLHRIIAIVFLSMLFGVSTVNADGPGSQRNRYPVAEPSVVQAFAERIEPFFNTDTLPENIGDYVSMRQMASRSLPRNVPSEFRRGFIHGFTEDGINVFTHIQGLRQRYPGPAIVEFRGVAQRDSLAVARFRYTSPDNAHFFDLLVAEGPNGPVIIDVFTITRARWDSEVAAEALLSHLRRTQDGVTFQGPMAGHTQTFDLLGQAAQRGEHVEALRLYDSLPPRVQNIRLVFEWAVDAARHLPGPTRYFALIDALANRLPSDPGVQVLRLHSLLARQRWNEASSTLQVVRTLFPDSYWDTMESVILSGRGELAQAREVAERAVVSNPTVYDAHQLALLFSLVTNRTDRAVVHAQTLRDRFGADLRAIAALPGYEGLRRLSIPAAN